jgi:hypothetical protein
MTEKKSIYAETIEKKEKENATNFFFSVCSRSAQFDFFFTERKSKKKWKKREESCSTVVTPFFLSLLYVSVCVRLPHPLVFFFCIYMRAFGVCKHTSMRARIERQKRRKKKIRGRKRMENTRTLLCFLNIDNSEGSESREKGGQATIGKYILAERKEKQKVVWKCVLL